jgi:cell wall-associated NlpC family hydrolase
MPKQLDAVSKSRVLTRVRILAAAVPAASAAGLLSAPTTAPAKATGNDVVAAYAGSKELQRFETAIGVDPLFPRLDVKRGDAPRMARVTRTLRELVLAGNRIARRPYVFGGGHGSFDAAGYDCSGSVSYVLHAAGLLSAPQDSGGLESYGDPGPGRHVTIYANGGHALLTIDGRRFDTIALQETGTRWSATTGDTSGYVVRHPHGL